MSRTSPSWSTARQRYIRSPAIRTTISSRCQRLPSRDDRSEFQYPTSYRLVGGVEPSLGEEFLDVAIAQHQAQIEPDRMLDDHRRKAVAATGDFGHRASL